jgi:hypothetical protein
LTEKMMSAIPLVTDHDRVRMNWSAPPIRNRPTRRAAASRDGRDDWPSTPCPGDAADGVRRRRRWAADRTPEPERRDDKSGDDGRGEAAFRRHAVAMAKAIASGRATMPTMPAVRSVRNWRQS